MNILLEALRKLQEDDSSELTDDIFMSQADAPHFDWEFVDGDQIDLEGTYEDDYGRVDDYIKTTAFRFVRDDDDLTIHFDDGFYSEEDRDHIWWEETISLSEFFADAKDPTWEEDDEEGQTEYIKESLRELAWFAYDQREKKEEEKRWGHLKSKKEWEF